MSREQAKKDQPTKLITMPISDPRLTQDPTAEIRKLNLPVPIDEAEKDLFLVVLDKDASWDGKKDEDDNNYQMYLGRSKTFQRGEGPDYYNTLVPLIPRCHASPDRHPAHAVEVPEGWLYIIRQFTNPLTGSDEPELWRELKSDGLGNFSDVNLNRFGVRDQRRATGQPVLRIIVPYCIDQQVHQVWMAYSEVQWSWNRVQSMIDDADLRDQRMHKLDLSDCQNNFANSHYRSLVDVPDPILDKLGVQGKAAEALLDTARPFVDKAASRLEKFTNGLFPPQTPPQEFSNQPAGAGQCKAGRDNSALLYNLEFAPDAESRDLPEIFKEAIPVVYLDNPIGIGRRLAEEYQGHWQELTQCVNNLRAIPTLIDNPGPYAPGSAELAEYNTKHQNPERWFEAAALANRYFCSDISKVIPAGVKDVSAYEKRLTEVEEQFIQYQNKLDMHTIEQAIRLPQRNAIRKKLVRARETLVAFLKQELAAIDEEDTGSAPQDPPLVLALDDYFTLSPLGNRERKQNPTDVIGDKFTPRWRDNYLDGWSAVYALVAYLGKHEYSIDADLEANPKDGWAWRRSDPAFELLRRLSDPKGGYPLHSRLFPKAASNTPLKIDTAKVEDTTTAFKIQHFDNFQSLIRRDADVVRGLNLFGSNFNELMAMRDKNDPAYEKSLERSQNSILRLIEGAFGMELEKTDKSLAELIAEAEKQLEDKHEKKIAKDAFLKSAGFLQKTIDTADEFPEKSLPGSKQLRNIRVRVIRAADTQRLRRLLYDLSDEDFVSSGLGGILGLVEIHNFQMALKAFSSNRNPDRNWELFAPMAASFLKIPSAIKDAKDAAVAAGKVAEGTGRVAGKRSAFEIGSQSAEELSRGGYAKLLKTASVIGDLIDIGVTLSSFTENLAQNDDAAIADAVGFTGATLGVIGTVFAIPVLGWVAGLVGIAAWLAKAFLFKEDTPVEIWIANGPFARGEEYHEQFSYHRSSTIAKIRNAKGDWVDTACTVHEYGSFQFLVDRKGTLVHAGLAPPPATAIAGYGLYIPGTMENRSPCKVAPSGNVYLKADPEKNIPADTHVATVGERFEMHRLLKPSVKQEPAPARKTNSKTIAWSSPHDAYLALADALYRPRVSLTEIKTHADNKCALKIKLPFYLPGKSRLFIEFGEANQPLRTFGPGTIENLKTGSSEYELIEQFPYWETKTFTAKVRLELLGKGDVQLPHELLFGDDDIETRIDEHTNKGIQSRTETKWIVADKKIAGKEKTHSKLESYVDLLIDNIKNTF